MSPAPDGRSSNFTSLSPGKKRDGSTDLNKRGRVPQLNRAPVEFTKEELEKARGVVAASAKDAYDRNQTEDAGVLLETLGLLPSQTDWYELKKDGNV